MVIALVVKVPPKDGHKRAGHARPLERDPEFRGPDAVYAEFQLMRT